MSEIDPDHTLPDDPDRTQPDLEADGTIADGTIADDGGATQADTPAAKHAVPTLHDTIGEYEIEGELGKGAMGVVYKAYQKKLNRRVALKILPPALALSQTYIDRFQREARASADLHHNNIAPIYDIGHDVER